MVKANRLHTRIEPVLGFRHCSRAYTAIGDPARRPGIPQQLYWHGTVRQGSVRFNLSKEASSPPLFLSRCTYSLVHLFKMKPNRLFTFLLGVLAKLVLELSQCTKLNYYPPTKQFSNWTFLKVNDQHFSKNL